MHASWTWFGRDVGGDWRDRVADASEPFADRTTGFDDVFGDFVNMAGVIVECAVAPVIAFAEGARGDLGWRWGRHGFTAADAPSSTAEGGRATSDADKEGSRGRHRGRWSRHRGWWGGGFGAKEGSR